MGGGCVEGCADELDGRKRSDGIVNCDKAFIGERGETGEDGMESLGAAFD